MNPETDISSSSTGKVTTGWIMAFTSTRSRRPPPKAGFFLAESNRDCSGCGQPIRDRSCHRTGQSLWHERCLRCCMCGSPLANYCYLRCGKLFCRADYRRCWGCEQVVSGSELVMHPESSIYHIHCFKCNLCGRRLERGESFALDGSSLYCYNDYKQRKILLSFKAAEEGRKRSSDLSATESDSSGTEPRRAQSKRPRTVLTSLQRKAFKASFEISPRPCKKVREELSKATGLNIRVVQVWFQNQRAKLKKIARKNGEESEQSSKRPRKRPPKLDRLHACSEDGSVKGDIPSTALQTFMSDASSVEVDDLLFDPESRIPDCPSQPCLLIRKDGEPRATPIHLLETPQLSESLTSDEDFPLFSFRTNPPTSTDIL